MSETDFGGRLDALMAIDPTAPAIEHDGVWHHWGALGAAVAAIDTTLLSAGIARHHRVGLLLRNRPPQLAAMLALFGSGRTLVVLNPMLARETLLADLAGLRLAVVIGEPADLAGADLQRALATAGCAVLSLAAGLHAPRIEAQARPDRRAGPDLAGPEHADTAVEMLTSGTTGPPKRIPLSRRAFDAALDAALIYEKDRHPGEPPKLRPGVSLHVGPLA
ncbi:MAG: AMP-binding protein, partial [Janthinobacterium lividum]